MGFFTGFMLALGVGVSAPTFGPEFNFTNEALLENYAGREGLGFATDMLSAYQERFLDEVLKACADCSRTGEFTIASPRGWSMSVTIDPGVVEIKTNPMTTAQIDLHREEM